MDCDTGEGAPFVGYNINGVWNVDRETDSVMIIHAGTKLYSSENLFTSYTELLTGLPDVKSSGFYLNNYLIILNGTRALVYGNFGGTWSIGYLDEKGEIPTIGIGYNPDGTNGTSYQKPNLLNVQRQVTMLADGLNSVYQLPETGLDITNPIVTILDVDGEWKPTTAFTYDAVLGKVTFTNPPPQSPVVGRDNVRIIYSKTNSEYLDHINKATKGILYGYGGNNNRLFVTGEPKYLNIDWYSEANNPLYFPDDGFTVIGSQPIMSYSLLNNGQLAILKDITDSDYTVYYRSGLLYNGKEVFPIEYGVRSVGCLANNTSDNLLNDPLVLTTDGISGLVSNGKEEYAHPGS